MENYENPEVEASDGNHILQNSLFSSPFYNRSAIKRGISL
jgi:hypothetical protein